MVDFSSSAGDPPSRGTVAGPAGTISWLRRPGSGPTLVLVHGNTSDHSVWAPLAAALPEADLLALDSRGHGASGWPADPDYASTHFADDIAAVVDALRVERPILVGHSNGAISAALAASRPTLGARALVWIDIDPKVPESQREFFRQRAAAVGRVSPSIERIVTGMQAVDPTVPEPALRAHVEHLLVPLEQGWRFGFDPRFYAHWAPADLWPMLPALSLPTLVLRGAQSRVMSAEAAVEMARHLPAGRVLTLPDTGHWLPLGQPRALAQAVRETIAQTR